MMVGGEFVLKLGYDSAGFFPDDLLLSLPPMLLFAPLRAALLLPDFVSPRGDFICRRQRVRHTFFGILRGGVSSLYRSTLKGYFPASGACFFDSGGLGIGLRFHGDEGATMNDLFTRNNRAGACLSDQAIPYIQPAPNAGELFSMAATGNGGNRGHAG